MPKLELYLLGAPQWLLDGAPLKGFATRKTEALLSYLVVNRYTHQRSALAALFWPEMAEEHAQNNLRRTLSNLRSLVGSHLVIDRQTVAFATHRPYWLDVEQFTHRLTPLLAKPMRVSLSPERLEEALALYRDDFLAGFVVHDALPFDEWLRKERERFHELAVQALEQLITLYLQQQEFVAGLATTQRLLAMEPWRESTHQQRMRLLSLTGQPANALAQFELCRKILAEEFQIDPQPETIALYQQIKAGAFINDSPAAMGEPARNVVYTLTSEAIIGAQHDNQALVHNGRSDPPPVEVAQTLEKAHLSTRTWEVTVTDEPSAHLTQPLTNSKTSGEAITSYRAVPPLPHNLPKQLTSFFGRTAEITELTTQLRQADYRLITLFGEGGVGKTRLALAVAQTLVDAAKTPETATLGTERPPFPDGIWYVPLAGIQPTADLTEQLSTTIAKAMGFVFTKNSALRKQLFTYVENKQALLILDNFEEFVAGRAFILELLQQTSNVTLLLTSRQLLNLQAEVAWSVGGLPIPSLDRNTSPKINATINSTINSTIKATIQGSLYKQYDKAEPTVDLTDLLRYPSIALFVERARRVQRTFHLTVDNWEDVVQICRLSAGLPLAIELAAAQVKLRTCAAIRQTLAAEATTLSTGYYDLPERHRNLATVLENSWQLLTQEERTVLAATSLFVESFTPEAGAAVAGAIPVISEALYDKSMLQYTHLDRYYLHPLVQQFAMTQLQQWGQAQLATVAARHGRYYLHLLRSQGTALHGPSPQTANALIRHDLSNIERAWQWAVAQQEAGLLVESCQGLLDFHRYTFLGVCGKQLFSDTIAMLQQQLAKQTPIYEAAARQQSAVEPLVVEQLEGYLATLLCALAHLLVTQDDHTEGIQTVQQALELAGKWNLSSITARGIYVWGFALTELGNYTLAEQKLTQALTLARTKQMTDLLFMILLRLGVLMKLRGVYSTALQFTLEALQLSRAEKMVAAEQHALTVLGTIYQERGDFIGAKLYYEQALPLAEACQLQINLGNLLINLGAVYDSLGQYDIAQRHYQAALQHYRHLGHRHGQAQVLGNLGISADYLGDYAAALRYSHESLTLLQALAMTGALPTVLVNLALHAHHLGDDHLAQSYGRQALALSQEGNNLHMQSYAWTVLGHAACGLSALDAAAAAYTSAIHLAQQMNTPFLMIEPLAGLVRVDLASAKSLPSLHDHVNRLLALVTQHGVTGLEEPFRVYLTCYQGLQALADPRAAEILQTAYRQLITRALQIEDEALRHSFLSYVAANGALVQAATADQRP